MKLYFEAYKSYRNLNDIKIGDYVVDIIHPNSEICEIINIRNIKKSPHNFPKETFEDIEIVLYCENLNRKFYVSYGDFMSSYKKYVHD